MSRFRHGRVWTVAMIILAALVAVCRGPELAWANGEQLPAQPPQYLSVAGARYSVLRWAGGPEIGARAAIVVEYPSGRVLYSKAMHDRLPPASTTKILTAILALEHGSLEDQVTASQGDLVGESTMGLENGERVTMRNLLYGLLLPSGNDAAMAIARHIGSLESGPNPEQKDPVLRFADMMNARASQLGMAGSHFVNPHGLDAEEHYSTAYDLANLTWYALHFPVFDEVVKSTLYEAPGHSLRNTNEMLSRYPGADGVKTGWTDAGGLCLVTSATRDGHRLISVVLNAPHWYKDSTALLDYSFARLAAMPQDASAEVLSVARRGTASWLLVSASPAPSEPARAVPTVATLAQGGGAAPPAKKDEAPRPNAPAPNAGEAHRAAPPLTTSLRQTAPRTAGPVRPSFPWWAGALTLLALAGTLLLIAWRRGLWPGRRLTGLALALPRPAEWPPAQEPYALWATAPQREAPPPPPARTLGVPPVPRRREPNLLLSPDQAARQHVLRAIDLAAEGKQGSSMAEFLLALRLGHDIDAPQLDKSLGLTPAALLALSRAQQAAAQKEQARQTLRYALSAAPGDRLLQLALYQLSIGQAPGADHS